MLTNLSVEGYVQYLSVMVLGVDSLLHQVKSLIGITMTLSWLVPGSRNGESQ